MTNVSAETLTVNGSTVEQITNAQIAAISAVTATSASNGIAVSVTTQGGSVTAVAVDATSFGNVMHLAGVVAAPSAIATPAAGDIVVIGSQPAAGYVTGQEYIYTNAGSWELIGDQSTYAINAYTSTATVLASATTLPTAIDALGAAVDALNASVSTLASEMTSVSSVLAGLGDAAEKSVANTLDSSATTLPTCSAVAAYVAAAIASAMSWIEE